MVKFDPARPGKGTENSPDLIIIPYIPNRLLHLEIPPFNVLKVHGAPMHHHFPSVVSSMVHPSASPLKLARFSSNFLSLRESFIHLPSSECSQLSDICYRPSSKLITPYLPGVRKNEKKTPPATYPRRPTTRYRAT